MKTEKSRLKYRNTKDHKRLLTISNYMTIKWTSWKKWMNSQKSITSKIEPGRNRK